LAGTTLVRIDGVQTASVLQAHLPTSQLLLDPDLRERHLGCLQGYTLEEAHALFPEASAALHSRDPARRVPGGESPADVIGRAEAFLERMATVEAGAKQCTCYETICIRLKLRKVQKRMMLRSWRVVCVCI
jgi:broad specificity phosphatase PhoE